MFLLLTVPRWKRGSGIWELWESKDELFWESDGLLREDELRDGPENIKHMEDQDANTHIGRCKWHRRSFICIRRLSRD